LASGQPLVVDYLNCTLAKNADARMRAAAFFARTDFDLQMVVNQISVPHFLQKMRHHPRNTQSAHCRCLQLLSIRHDRNMY